MKERGKRSYVRIFLLLLLVGVFAAVVKLDAGEQLRVWLERKRQASIAEQRFVNPALDAEARAPVAPSLWKEAEKKRYAALLAQSKPDVIVLPYQIPIAKDQFGVDLSARMVMAYMTAQRLALDSALKVADVELAARATGEPRHMTRDEAVAFGRSVGAATIVYGTASHDGERMLSVKIVRASTKPGTQDRSATVERIAISDTQTPELAFRKVIDGLMREIGVSQTPVARRHVVPDQYFPDVPASAASSDSDNPVAGLWTQQLLGSLHAGEGFRGKARVYERALAGLEFVDPGSPDYRLLAARALVQLERRPAALEMIGTPQSPEEAAFVEYLNGNAPDLTAAIEKIKRPLPKLLARIDLAQMGQAYNFDSSETVAMMEEAAQSAPAAWQPAVVWHISLRDRWLVRSTMEIKQVLDVQFPLAGYSAEDVLRGKAVTGFADNPRLAYEIEGAPLEHVRRVQEEQGKDWCCAPAAWQPRPFQYLALLSSLSEAMLLHGLERTHKVHGQPERALAVADLLAETALQGGHPQLQHRTMRILEELMNRERASGKRAALANRLYETAKQVRQWETGDPNVVTNAVYYEHQAANVRFAGGGGSAAYPELKSFKADFPPTHFSLRHSSQYEAALELNGDTEVIRRACSYAVFAMRACFAWRSALEAAGRSSEARKMEEELTTRRFRGNEYLVRHIVRAKLGAGQLAEAQAFTARAIALAPKRSRLYLDLGNLYLRTGDVDAARKVFLSYPAFSDDAERNSVRISGDADWAASAFANRGYLKEARHFYEIAARHDNGSGSYYAARKALAYMDRRFGEAAEFALRAAQHYPGGSTSYRYIALLFALGDSKAAWPAAREAINRYPGSTAWFALPVGFRMEEADATALGAWAVEVARLRGGDEGTMSALSIVVQTLAVDRTAESISAVRTIRDQVLPNSNPTAFTAEAARRNNGSGNRLDYIDRFIAGYAAHKRNDFEAAWNAFQSFPALGGTNAATDAFLTALPYHAYAAAKTGRSAAFSSYLEQYEKPFSKTPLDQPYDYVTKFDIYLARAALASAAGKHAEANKQLSLARSYNQGINARLLFPAYVYAEFCELLAADSGQREFLDAGVSLAKAHQVTEPWSAWAYAYEALHGTNAEERAKAYAIARHLDPQSARLSRAAPAIAKKADEWLAFNKPFPAVRKTPLQKAL